jgi:hypothetical protein
MSPGPTRRDFLSLGGLSLASLAFKDFAPGLISFDDADVVRVAANSVSVYSTPSDKSDITGTWHRDDLIHIYGQVTAAEPKANPIWYRVWGGYAWRSRLQRVRTIFNIPVLSIPEGTRLLAEVTVPFINPWRYSKTYGWEQLEWRLYYESNHWVDAVDEGPPASAYHGAWYRIWDHIASFPYFVPAEHLRIIPSEAYAAISPEVAWDKKRIEVNLTMQTLTAYENNDTVFKTTISSGIPTGNNTTHVGKFRVIEKLPTEHMGEANVYAAVDDYVLAGVPWTCYFTEDGQAFHGTFWHENFGTPMSHGCVNMRTNEALWLFRWATPEHTAGAYLNNRGHGTQVDVHF